LVERLVIGSNGQVSFPELYTDVLYKLVEEKAPNGYSIITKEIFFKLVPGDNMVSFTFCDSEGNASKTPNGVRGTYVTGNKILSLTVENIRGHELPSTGGCGTLLYILCGLILMFSPFVYGFRQRRKNERRLKQ
jgi:uncharacterized surface anchored protein